MHILLVDDDPDTLYLLESLLIGHGHQVETAQNGQQALEKAARSHFDLIISDILMPGMDGFQLCRHLKTSEDLHHTPFVFYTATYTDPQDREFALSLGAERFIIKPAEPVEFMAIIEETVRQQAAGRETARPRVSEESVYLRQYNQRLTSKLEDKMLQLESLNRELQAATENIQFLTSHDPLTGLPNRTLFQDRLAVALAHARRNRCGLATLLLEVDRLRLINETLGPTAGDHLLRELAGRLRESVREDDTVARLGGQSFAIILTEIGQSEEAARLADSILAALARPWAYGGQVFPLAANIGISLYPADGEDMETLLQNAEAALHRAQEQGTNTCCFYTPAMQYRARARLTMENQLRHGLEQEQFTVYYQPQVDTRTRRITGVEALVRWQHPQEGLLSPARFIPLAEESGLIVPLGEWVLRSACAQARKWQALGYPPMRMAVNLSPRQFYQPNLVTMVAKALEDSGLAPGRLQLEITESTAVQDMERAAKVLQELQAMGVSLTIDDFGTGYSSLNCLRHLPITGLKIDRSFVQEVTTNPRDAVLVSTLIDLARSLSLRVVAEGVESPAQLHFLEARQCDELQGYLFSQPVPAADLEPMLRRGGWRRP